MCKTTFATESGVLLPRQPVNGEAVFDPQRSSVALSICTATQVDARSLDHLVGASKQRRRKCEAERLGGSQIEHQVDLHRALHGQITRLFPFENTPDVSAHLTIRAFRSPGQAARQLPDQSTTLWVESSSTNDPRLRGALPRSDVKPAPSLRTLIRVYFFSFF